MKSVLQITTPDEIGLLEKASEFIFRHDGSIVSDTVSVYGEMAFLLLHFEADPNNIELMRSALETYPTLSRLAQVELIDTNEPSEAQPGPTELSVWCRDIKGLLATITKLIQSHEYPILSHVGARTISWDDVNYEYMQKFTLSISRRRLEQETVIDGRNQKVLRWTKFKSELQQVLEPLGGRFAVR